MGYTVAQRTREIGIRMALGAHPSSVLTLVLRQAMTVAAAGVAVGWLAALMLTGVMRRLLYGITATDPVTFGSVPLLLLLVAVVAAYVPARKASRIDPLAALRHE
jgi:ABC-type antimicrobial peptide transport system permease subunit